VKRTKKEGKKEVRWSKKGRKGERKAVREIV
jgi:hypothetical protein